MGVCFSEVFFCLWEVSGVWFGRVFIVGANACLVQSSLVDKSLLVRLSSLNRRIRWN